LELHQQLLLLIDNGPELLMQSGHRITLNIRGST
jgi:hypothetical protein